jgi:type II secretory pathway component PulF
MMKKYVIQYTLEKGLTTERTVEAKSREDVAEMALSEQIVQFEDVFGELNLFNKDDIKLVKIKDFTEPVNTSRRGG